MIGVYDSGLGGLTVLRYLRQRMPQADLLYLGDTVHLPYGEKPPSLLRNYAEDAFQFFRAHGVSALIVACGTVSTVVLEDRACNDGFPILGVARPAADRLRSLGCKRIALLATEATVASGVYERLLQCPGVKLFSLACPHLVPLAESGRMPRGRRLLNVLERELHPLRDFSPDAILLGCTHFPLFEEAIAALYPSAVIVDCGRTAAELLDPERYGCGDGRSVYCVTGSPARFHAVAGQLFSFDAKDLHQIELSK